MYVNKQKAKRKRKTITPLDYSYAIYSLIDIFNVYFNFSFSARLKKSKNIFLR